MRNGTTTLRRAAAIAAATCVAASLVSVGTASAATCRHLALESFRVAVEGKKVYRRGETAVVNVRVWRRADTSLATGSASDEVGADSGPVADARVLVMLEGRRTLLAASTYTNGDGRGLVWIDLHEDVSLGRIRARAFAVKAIAEDSCAFEWGRTRRDVFFYVRN